MNIKRCVTIMLCGVCGKYYCKSDGVKSFQGLSNAQIEPKIDIWKAKQYCIKIRLSSGNHSSKLKCQICRTLPEPDPPE